jgi:hypothetical protein
MHRAFQRRAPRPPCKTISPARCTKLVARTTPLVLIVVEHGLRGQAAIRMLPPSASIF